MVYFSADKIQDREGFSMIYCMSDIHGEYELFMEMLEKINFSEQDTLYILGDVIDRGKHPVKILQEMMKHPNIIPIIGNHELMGITCLYFLMNDDDETKIDEETLLNLQNWIWNGGKTTIDEFLDISKSEQIEIIKYLEEFIIYEELTVADSKYILVHSGLGNFSPKKLMDDYTLDELVWNRTEYEMKYFDDIYVVSGHTPTQTIKGNPNPSYIYRRNNHIAIDCGACFAGGRLAVICLDTGEEFYTSHYEEQSQTLCSD